MVVQLVQCIQWTGRVVKVQVHFVGQVKRLLSHLQVDPLFAFSLVAYLGASLEPQY